MTEESKLWPVIGLFCAQLFTSSWHILGKHVFSQVPYVAPISFVLIRTLVSSSVLFVAGIIKEGYVPFPSLFVPNRSDRSVASSTANAGIIFNGSTTAIASGNSVGLALSQSSSLASIESAYHSGQDKKVDDPPTAPRRNHHRPTRRRRSTKKMNISWLFEVTIPLLGAADQLQCTRQSLMQWTNNLNPEALQVIFAGLAGMCLLPCCYTTGLVLTSPTVASVYDGPLIPLGCFCAAVGLGIEKRSRSYPSGQVGSLLLTVFGSIIVLLVDFIHTRSIHKAQSTSGEDSHHEQFIRGNLVLLGVVAAYSATALLQKQLTHRPPIQLTSWMFGCGFTGCLCLLTVDSFLGGRITGCSIVQALSQLYVALTTSPTFRCGLLYSALFVGGACFAIGSYASSHLDSSVITLFAATQPPITAVLEWIWEGKGLGGMKLFGFTLVVTGMYLFTYIKQIEKKRIQHRLEKYRRKRETPQCCEKDEVQICRKIADV
ncbi:hypothetical protein THAOC_02898 [Thalassiosira oceanica]|uniref:EamA domain-containing protein n=1 Tax=Thalassiosira oceanica TaxID=159749 RepID=K0TE00_THAOC|nr:hypothetical protein THAOC_02898 [Thalassiosira oceanica]|eukprot:EJK75379.1 hypothetical protein THAOC_02898 [Thalassiosira oceanica]